MKPSIDFFVTCDNCKATTSNRHPIRGGILCGQCYQGFLKSVSQPVSVLSLAELRAAKDIRQVPAPPTQVTVSSTSVLPTKALSTLEKLQFKKFIADNSGMALPEVDAFLESASEEEKRELTNAFLGRQVQPPLQQQTAVELRVVQENASQPKCPKCSSIKTTFNKQGYGVGKAAIGVLVTGGFGLLAGGIGANDIVLRCFDCGHRWKA